MKINDVVILVGGKGSRLGLITKNIPKPLLKINNITFLDHLICKLIKYNFKNIFLLCSYKKKLFFNKYHNKFFHNSKIVCIDEGKPKGTGGALFKLKTKIKKNFILINGDTFFDINFDFIIKNKMTNKSVYMCLVDKKKTINNYNIINLDIKKNIIQFSKKKTKYMNGGIYLINKKILNKIKNKFISFENDILKKEIKAKKVIGKFYKDFFVDIGSRQKLNMIRKNPNLLQNKCFFLDRDGVINEDIGYITNFKNFIFLKGVGKAIKYLNDKKFLVIIITNQAAIGKEIITEKTLDSIHLKMCKYLQKKNKSIINDIFYSSYFKDSKKPKYKKDKFDRKPNPGMILKAIKKWNIDPTSSFFIGDKITDKIAAKKTNLKFYFKKNISLYKQIKKVVK